MHVKCPGIKQMLSFFSQMVVDNIVQKSLNSKVAAENQKHIAFKCWYLLIAGDVIFEGMSPKTNEENKRKMTGNFQIIWWHWNVMYNWNTFKN